VSAARRLGRALLWPIRRVLDPRFADVNRRLTSATQEIEATRTDVGSLTGNFDQLVGGYTATNVEAMTFLGRQLRQLEASVDEVQSALHEVAHNQDLQHYVSRLERLAGADVTDLDGAAALLINFANSHRGFAAQRNLWLNPPLTVEHLAGDVRLGNVNERIVELPYALSAMRTIAPGASILDFGAAESTLSLSLASLGYLVTALDLREYPFSHPLLESVASPLEQWETGARQFDAVLCVSTVEHVGLGWYGGSRGDEDGDLRAMRRLLELTRPGGLLVLTVPYGRPGVDDVQRRYDRRGLDALLDGWDETDRRIVERIDGVTWKPAEDSDGHAVALVTARAPEAT
jgi:SAM-dependent methyltransferase